LTLINSEPAWSQPWAITFILIKKLSGIGKEGLDCRHSEDHTRPPPDTIQQPTAHLGSEPDIVELHKINHDEPNEPRGNIYIYSNAPPLVKPKKKS